MCMKESLSETGPLWLSAVKRLPDRKDRCPITLTSCVSMTPRTAQNLNMATKELVAETTKLCKSSQIWLKGFDAFMRWFFKNQCAVLSATERYARVR